MELSPFKIKNKQKQMMMLIVILLFLFMAIIVIIQSYALYEVQKEYDVIEGNVPSHMDNFDVKVALTIDGTPSTTFPEKGSGKAVDNIVCDKDATATWDYEKWDIIVHNVKQTKTKCLVNFVTRYFDPTLNGNDPVLGKGMIPVNISDDGVVTRANTKTSWYNYSQKKWANAVILVNEEDNYNVGQVIPEDKIESYFVWIPKFDYQIFSITNYSTSSASSVKLNDVAAAKAINIRFNINSTANTSTECVSPNESGVLGSCTVGKWMTHPAFVDGFEGKRGMWVGKFEPSHNAVTAMNETNPNAVQIKPNVISWRDIQVANAFYSVYDYKRELDSHMMKNTEWGAIAYLTHSIYGSCASTTSCQEVRINNNSNHITGYSAVDAPTCGYSASNDICNKYGTGVETTLPWNTTTGYLASTTGNISGIYDMAGGSWEYVMGVMVSKEGKLVSGRENTNNLNSNFNGMFTYPPGTSASFTTGVDYPSDDKYYDLYQYVENDETYERMILGDATGELGPFGNAIYGSQTRRISSWFTDEAWFVVHEWPWFNRGGGWNIGSGVGVFAFGHDHGRANSGVSFRVVLSPVS